MSSILCANLALNIEEGTSHVHRMLVSPYTTNDTIGLNTEGWHALANNEE
jgi:hypothetical protein